MQFDFADGCCRALNPLRGIQAVTFDVGGTLIAPWPSVGQVYAAVAARHGIERVAPDFLERSFAAAWGAKQDFDYSKTAWFDLVRATFAGAEAPLVDEFLEDVYARFARPETWRVYDDVAPAFDALASRGIDLAVISNWDERLRPLLSALKLDGYLETIVVSSEVGFAKPSAVIFEQALRALGLAGEAVLHVGDSLTEDVAGARGAGLRALHLDRKATPGEGRIESLLELAGGAPV